MLSSGGCWSLLILSYWSVLDPAFSNMKQLLYNFQVLCLSVVSVGVWTIGFKSFISGLLTDRLFLSCAYLQV